MDTQPPMEVAGEGELHPLMPQLECPLSTLFPYLCRIGLLALPVFRVGRLAHVYSFGNA